MQPAYEDLRDWLELVDDLGELCRLKGADTELEIGALTDIARNLPSRPALLFEEINGFAPGHRLLSNPLASLNRFALTARLPLNLPMSEYVRLWPDRLASLKPLAPVQVTSGPVLENVESGTEVDVTKFPAPLWHEKDGGKYIGTGCVVVTRDPDTEWVNLGTYRIQVFGPQEVGLYISPGHHGRIHREKYFARGLPCPVAIAVGADPLHFLVASLGAPNGVCEYDLAGGIRGEPVEVIRGLATGLPIPATAEIVIEGEQVQELRRPEGPFGEWPGYYASGSREEPVVQVKTIYYRNDPIILGSPPRTPPYAASIVYGGITRASEIRKQVEGAGVPDVVDVWVHDVGGTHMFTVISIRQRYPGHAKQAAMAATFSRTGAYLGRYTIVVDEDIDVYDLNHVMWAVCTRSDPAKDIEIVRRCWSGPLDPIIPPDEKGFNSRAIIDACRPYEWKDKFPEVVRLSPELRDATWNKWKDALTAGRGAR